MSVVSDANLIFALSALIANAMVLIKCVDMSLSPHAASVGGLIGPIMYFAVAFLFVENI